MATNQEVPQSQPPNCDLADAENVEKLMLGFLRALLEEQAPQSANVGKSKTELEGTGA
jgi:hypothetical protein